MKITTDIDGTITIKPVSKAEEIALEIMLTALQEITSKCFGYNSYLEQMSKDADSAILALLENKSKKV